MDLDTNAMVNSCLRCTTWQSSNFQAERTKEMDSILGVSGQLGWAETVVVRVVKLEFGRSFSVEAADSKDFKGLLDLTIVIEGSFSRTN